MVHLLIQQIMPTTSNPSINQLRRAVQIAEQIQKLEAELASILKGAGLKSSAASVSLAASTVKAKGKKGARKKRVMSPEAREKIAAAQRARWARQKKTK
jgi:hypothetical protein